MYLIYIQPYLLHRVAPGLNFGTQVRGGFLAAWVDPGWIPI